MKDIRVAAAQFESGGRVFALASDSAVGVQGDAVHVGIGFTAIPGQAGEVPDALITIAAPACRQAAIHAIFRGHCEPAAAVKLYFVVSIEFHYDAGVQPDAKPVGLWYTFSETIFDFGGVIKLTPVSLKKVPSLSV